MEVITLIFLHEIEPEEETDEKGTGEEPEMERCVICGKQTNVPKNLHILFRDCYIPSLGQLCRKCWNQI